MAQLTGEGIVGDTSSVHTEAKNTLCRETMGVDGHKYIYLKGVASTVAGSWVTFDELGITALIDTDVAASCLGPVAIAQAAVVANTWGWYLRKGSSLGKSGTVADNAAVYPTSTAGSVDDTLVLDMQIIGAVSRSAGADATFQINDPFMGVIVNETE